MGKKKRIPKESSFFDRENWSVSDKEYGWRFGSEGFMSMKETMEFLKMSRSSVDRLIEMFTLRAGKNDPDCKTSKVKICKRSVLEYAASLER